MTKAEACRTATYHDRRHLFWPTTTVIRPGISIHPCRIVQMGFSRSWLVCAWRRRRDGIWIAMASPPMPTVGAGSSRFSRRFPRPPQPPSHRASPLRIVLPSPRRPPHCAYPRAPPSRIVYVIFAELLAHCLFLLVNSRYLCGVPRWWGINFIRLV